MKKSNHQVKVVRVPAPAVHPNADNLELIHIGGYQVVVKKGQFKEGNLAIYIQPDSVVPQTEPFRFIWENYQTEPDGAVPEKRRRITVRKFRKEWSEGLLMPVSDFRDGNKWDAEWSKPDQNIVAVYVNGTRVEEGDDVSDILNITHYEPPEEPESTGGCNEAGPRGKWPRSLKGWFYFFVNGFLRLFGIERWGVLGGTNQTGPKLGLPVYDVDAYKNYVGKFVEGEPVVVTEKIHGSNARYVYLNGKMYAGSRTLWKAPKSNCVWRKALEQNPWIELWCKAHEGWALYGEVVPTQKEPFRYGCEQGQVKLFVFDVMNPQGEWVNWEDIEGARKQLNWVPVLYEGPFSEPIIKQFVDGSSQVTGANHIREGCVVKPTVERHVTGLGRLILKLVSNKYLEMS